MEQNTHLHLRCRALPHIADNPPLPQARKEVPHPCAIEGGGTPLGPPPPQDQSDHLVGPFFGTRTFGAQTPPPHCFDPPTRLKDPLLTRTRAYPPGVLFQPRWHTPTPALSRAQRKHGLDPRTVGRSDRGPRSAAPGAVSEVNGPGPLSPGGGGRPSPPPPQKGKLPGNAARR